MQRLNCANRPECLDIAIAQRWPSFACHGCKAYVHMTGDQIRADVGPLISCRAVIVASLFNLDDRPGMGRFFRRMRRQ